MGEYGWYQVDHGPREAGVLDEPYACVHVVWLLGEEGEHPLEVSNTLLHVGLALAVVSFQGRNIARRYIGNAQGAAHDGQQPFGKRLAAELHDQDGRYPDKDTPCKCEQGQLGAEDEGGIRGVEMEVGLLDAINLSQVCQKKMSEITHIHRV